MSLQTAKKAIEFAVKNYYNQPKGKIQIGSPEIIFFGGEPMLRYDDLIKPLIEWANEKDFGVKIKYSMTTNGTLLNEEKLKFLKGNNVQILLSFDGCPQVQDDQRPLANGSNSSDLIIKNIPMILKYYPEVCIRATVQPKNANKIFEMYYWCRCQGFNGFFLAPNALEEWSDDNIAIALEQLSKIIAVWYVDIVTTGRPLGWSTFDIEVLQAFAESYRKDDIIIDENVELLDVISHCGLGMFSCAVDTQGNLVGCQEHSSNVEKDIFFIGDLDRGIDKNCHIKLLNAYLMNEHNRCIDNSKKCSNCSQNLTCTQPSCPSRDFDVSKEMGVRDKVSCCWEDFISKCIKILLEQLSTESRENQQKFLNYFGIGGEENGK